ncbi:hypothetical protein [Mesorhizobium sophorae]|uniref:hypothetical protein n=1 Tax=Mesorhizobium sophorae TaxID=1300294 RepID=UPI000BA3FFEE|nr:hypothetical protein [Mesorhizobium sophorae]
MNIGALAFGTSRWELTGTSSGNFPSGLDDAIAATLATGGSYAYVGPQFAGGVIQVIKIDGQPPAAVPPAVNFQPSAGLAVAALCVRGTDGIRLFLPSQPGVLAGKWVDVPRTSEFQAMAASDRDQQRKTWISALSKVPRQKWPPGIDLSRNALAAVSGPALRMLLAYLASYACPVTGVNQPGQKYRGGQTHGLTLPLLRYPVSEPDCYIHVIAGQEGLLESINAYDLGAGISLGSIQFNVNRAAIFKFLDGFEQADPDLFASCFAGLGWVPKKVTVGSSTFFALDAIDGSGQSVELIGRDPDNSRNCGYFQSAFPGKDNFDQIDSDFRKKLAGLFRDAVLWPHVQEQVMSVSAQWLQPGLGSIEATGIPPVDPMRPDRDTFILKSLLLSAYVRYSACLAPLLRALKPYGSPAAKLAALDGVLLAADTWSSCDQSRRSKLAARLDAQKPDAVAAWEVLNRLAGPSHGAPPVQVAAAILAVQTDADDHSCEHDHALGSAHRLFWHMQSAAAVDYPGSVRERFTALLEKEAKRAVDRKPARSDSIGVNRGMAVRPGDIVVKITKSGRYKFALVDAVHDGELHVSGIEGGHKKWQWKGRHGRDHGLRALMPGKTALKEMAALEGELVYADPTVAILPFSSDERRAVVAPLLTLNDNDAALLWNQQKHPSASGISLARLSSALGPYVDFSAVKAALEAANGAASATDERVLVEAIHQFQSKVYADPGQCDGHCGESTLDNLGLYLGRPGLNQVDIANPTAQIHLNSIDKKLAGLADNPAPPATLNAANWFRHMTAPTFLGQTFRNGIQAVLVRRLRAAERHLLALPAYSGMNPVKLGLALGIAEFHRGARPTATTHSMHTFGLATDINYTGNPWLEGSQIVDVLKRARLLMSGQVLEGGTTAAGLLHAKLANRPTAEIYDTLWGLDRDFRGYLAARNDAAELNQLLDQHRQDGTPGIFNPGETNAHAADRWRNAIAADLTSLNGNDGFVDRDPCNGFLNLAKDLVVALRDFGCLAWGASDFGPGASGDIMHFDCRNTGLGRIINVGFVPPERRCA